MIKFNIKKVTKMDTSTICEKYRHELNSFAASALEEATRKLQKNPSAWRAGEVKLSELQDMEDCFKKCECLLPKFGTTIARGLVAKFLHQEPIDSPWKERRIQYLSGKIRETVQNLPNFLSGNIKDDEQITKAQNERSDEIFSAIKNEQPVLEQEINILTGATYAPLPQQENLNIHEKLYEPIRQKENAQFFAQSLKIAAVIVVAVIVIGAVKVYLDHKRKEEKKKEAYLKKA